MVNNICFNHKVNFIYSVDFSSGFIGHLYLIKSYPIHNVIGYVLKYSSNKLIIFESSLSFFYYTIFILIKTKIFKSGIYNSSFYFLYNYLNDYVLKNGICLHLLQMYDQIE